MAIVRWTRFQSGRHLAKMDERVWLLVELSPVCVVGEMRGRGRGVCLEVWLGADDGGNQTNE